MNRYLITIDGGTTNTRAVLWNQDNVMITTANAQIGVRNTAIDGNNNRLKDTVQKLIQTLLTKTGISQERISAVYASGMITSNVGLAEIPHLIAPASLNDFADGVRSVLIPEVFPLPIHFIPGLKNMADQAVSLDNLESMDIMRGEETETLALVSSIDNQNGCLVVLPGSHTKFVTVDRHCLITGCLTSLTGEMLSVLTEYSIVAEAVKKQFAAEQYDLEYLKAGFHAAGNTSCARAAFLVRIVSQFLTRDQNQCASFLLGAVLQNDIAAIRTSRALNVNNRMQVLIAGRRPVGTAMKTLLAEDGYFTHIRLFDNDPLRPMAGYGALLIAQRRKDF